jgi:hypothetical protein
MKHAVFRTAVHAHEAPEAALANVPVLDRQGSTRAG